jgi:hypothetical protein
VKRATLFAGPWPGEFGVFLGWAAGVRFAAQFYDETVVCGPPGWKPLVSDFAHEYVPRAFSGIPIGAMIKGGPNKTDLMKLVPHGVTHFPAVHTNRWGNVYEEPVGTRQLWFKYGKPRRKWDGTIILHARSRRDWGSARDWPQGRWNALVPELKKLDRRLIAIGSAGHALLPNGVEDCRGLPLQQVCDCMASADFVLGPSSGPMHLAALCGAPHLVWFGGDDGSPSPENNRRKIEVLKERYLTAWNPFAVPVYPLIVEDWQPSVERVAQSAVQLADFLKKRSGGMPSQALEPSISIRYGHRRNRSTRGAPVVGICILAYEQPELLKAAVLSVQRHTQGKYELCVFDNGEKETVGAWLAENAPSVTYFAAPRNLGCAIPRNYFARFCRRRGYENFVFMDQDVGVTADGWLSDMLGEMAKHDDTAIVAWPLANRIPPEHAPDATGAVPEVPGLCGLYRTAAALQVPCCEEYKHFRFDSDWCLNLAKHGWKTRLVQGQDKIKHEHPHSGVNMDPERDAVRRQSERLFRRRTAELGFQEVGV